MHEARFVVPGQPVPKARPRFSKSTQCVYTPGKSKKYEKHVAHTAYLELRYGRTWPSTGDCDFDLHRVKLRAKCGCVWCSGLVAVTLRFYMKDRRVKDCDNLAKAVLDGMNGVAFRDDSQVNELHIFREVDKENPRVEVEVRLGGDRWADR